MDCQEDKECRIQGFRFSGAEPQGEGYAREEWTAQGKIGKLIA